MPVIRLQNSEHLFPVTDCWIAEVVIDLLLSDILNLN